MKNDRIIKLYKRLRATYGRPQGQWVLWCKRPKTLEEKEEVAIGAILTQQTNWNNVDKAILNLKNAGIFTMAGVYNLGKRNKEALSDLIRPSGFYRQKTEYLFNLASVIHEQHGGLHNLSPVPLPDLRRELLSIKGVGQETADSVILYAVEKSIFVIDEYTKRFARKNNLTTNFSYLSLQKLFESNLPKNYKLYQDYHALIVIDGQS